ncbi:SGNH/GDSL hydrolase family protein [Microbacterium lacus]|uniref:SGNH/GDSL hydrolase family protein n=1 Tax=Microbacterium lacus TaxID=415217 RepID=UPI00384F05D3
MNSAGRLRARRSWLTMILAAVAIVGVCLLGMWRPWNAVSPPDAGGRDAPQSVAAPALLALPETPRVLVFGDSWVYGSAATVPTEGFAYVLSNRLGWDAVIDGVRGSGYVKPGIDGGSYGERIAALDPALNPDLVILEGSINDRRLYPDGYRDAVTSAWNNLAALYPEARIVILGPAPQVLPLERATGLIDQTLSELAAERGWWYISPISDDWITEANYLDVIDTGEIGRNHPSSEGHAYLADRLGEALEAIRDDTTVIAEAPPHADSLAP